MQTSADQTQVDKILNLIRERARRRGSVLSGPSQGSPELTSTHQTFYDLTLLKNEAIACSQLQSAVGTINPRGNGIHDRIIQSLKKIIRRSLTWYTRPLHEFHAASAKAVTEATAALEDLQNHMALLTQRLDSAHPRASEMEIAMNLGQMLALNDSHTGPRAREGLWFNEPVIIDYDDHGKPRWARTSERIVEKSWVTRQLAKIPAGSRILDVGCSESLLSMELASTGFFVTGVDVRPYPLRHPQFCFIQGSIGTAPLPQQCFDGAVLLSTIEHIGLGWYGDPKGDAAQHQAMEAIWAALKAGGRLFLTTPFGIPAITPLHRIFDGRQLRKLLERFSIETLEFAVRTDEHTWEVSSETAASNREHHPETWAPGAVALATCRKSE